jgi:hypothetical protein
MTSAAETALFSRATRGRIDSALVPQVNAGLPRRFALEAGGSRRYNAGGAKQWFGRRCHA